MRRFLLLWCGQLVSLFGSVLASFGLGIWVYQRTGSVTDFSLIALSAMLPGLLFLPLAGVLVDRMDRRRAMVLGSLGSALAPLALAVLAATGRIALWHIYLLLGIGSAFQAITAPALSAWTTTLVEKRHLARASGMLQLGDAVARIGAPLAGGVLLGRVELWLLLLADALSFLFVIAAALATPSYRPAPPASAGARPTLWRELREGWAYIRERPGLLGLLWLLTGTNFNIGMVQTLLTPLVLTFASAATVGVVTAVAGVGLLAGSLIMSVWDGPRQRVRWIAALVLVQGCVLLVGGLRPSSLLIGLAAAVYTFCTPFINALSQAIWQAKTSLHVQGRVLALRRMVLWSSLPLAYAVAGPLADRVFEPLMAPGGLLADSVGLVIGVGPGRGIGLLFLLMSLFAACIVAVAFRDERVRRVEEDLPDILEPRPVYPVAQA